MPIKKSPTKRLPKMKESAIQKSILEALAMHDFWCWRVNAGTYVVEHNGKSRAIKGAPPGTPDIIGVLFGGRMFGLEVKTATGKQTDKQADWQEKATKRGVRYAVVRTWTEALERVREWDHAERMGVKS